MSLYEAADIDGASIWQKIRYIDLPTLVPTAMMVFILDCGKLLSSNTNKVLVLQTSGNIPTSDILGVYVYTVGLGSGQFSYTSAIGLFVNVINFDYDHSGKYHFQEDSRCRSVLRGRED